MSVETADLWKAILTAWEASSLPATFKALWDTDYEDEYFTLHDQEALPTEPWPYCVLDTFSSMLVSRSTGNRTDELTTKQEIRDVRVRFNVFAKEITSDSRSCKEIAAYLVEEVMKVFGGHPSVAPTATITLSHGNHLITQYLTSYGVNVGDDQYQYVLDYNFRIDVPVAID